MAKIIPFKPKKPNDPVAEKMVEIANEIDAILLRHLEDETIEPKELVGLVFHRLGSLINHFERKDELIDVCEGILKRQAGVD
jgi:hypothetical protein